MLRLWHCHLRWHLVWPQVYRLRLDLSRQFWRVSSLAHSLCVPYQVAGATAILSAILLPVSQHYGIEGVWIVGVISGLFLLFLGYFRLEQFVGFIPTPVLTAFTTGIALNIVVNQIGNLLGLGQPAAPVAGTQGLGQLLTGDSTIAHLLNYLQSGLQTDLASLGDRRHCDSDNALFTQSVGKYLPGSLVGLILATVLTWIAGLDLPQIGTVTRAIVMTERLQFSQIDLNRYPSYSPRCWRSHSWE